MRCKREKRAKIRRKTSFERFVSEREHLELKFCRINQLCTMIHLV